MAPRSNTRRRCQAAAPCQVFTVILGRTPGFQQRHLRGHRNELAGRRGLKVSGNCSQPGSASGRAACPSRGSSPESPEMGICLRQVSSLGSVTLQRLGPLSLFLQALPCWARIKEGPREVSTWALGQARLSTPERRCSPTPACPSLSHEAAGRWDNGTMDGGAGKMLGAEESLVLCLGTQWHYLPCMAAGARCSEV